MNRIAHQGSTFIHATRAWCSRCGKVETARVVAARNGVFLERICKETGAVRTRIAASFSWYMERVGKPMQIEEIPHRKKSRRGCPFDCGVCEWHSTGLHLPVFSITNDCNLNCPKCFTYNRPDKKYYKTVEETRTIIRHIQEQQPNVQLINMTGGEPSLHPGLFDLIAVCREEGIERITVNTNGLRIATDRAFAQQLKEAGVQPVLSMDTLSAENSIAIYGKDIIAQKKKALEVLEQLEIPTTLLLVCIKGVNEEEVAEITAKYIKKDFVKSITIQNMTYTGLNGSRFQPREHITIDEVEELLAQKDEFSQDDFFPLGSYHPLCYSVAYYVFVQDRLIPLTKILGKDFLTTGSVGSYLLEPDANFSRDFLAGLNRLWAEGEDEEVIMTLKKTVRELYPADGTATPQQRRETIEKMTRMISIHPHMDEDNFDIDRVSRCGDLVPDESGKMIPACSYNLFYRQQDERFWKESGEE
ncbi:MAG: radical SAM protein [Candidatus Electrothrix communis]|nr:MAG: radical SAM protein [Candidatus Electrothrix communis]